MGIINKSITSNTNPQTLYEVPTGKDAIILSIFATDIDNTKKQVILKVYDRYNVEKFVIRIDIEQNKSNSINDKIILEQFDKLMVHTTTGSSSVLLNATEEIKLVETFPPSEWMFRGEYENKEYGRYQIVSYEGSLYISNDNVLPDILPTNQSYWSLFLEKSLPYIEIGTISVFAMNNLPDGWLKCNGAELNRITYSNLFDKIGTIYGSGDGSTTFRLPDLRGEFVRGWDDSRGIDNNRTFGSFQNHMFASHKHRIKAATTQDGTYNFFRTSPNTRYNSYVSPPAMENTGGTETRPRNISMLYCIKY